MAQRVWYELEVMSVWLEVLTALASTKLSSECLEKLAAEYLKVVHDSLQHKDGMPLYNQFP